MGLCLFLQFSSNGIMSFGRAYIGRSPQNITGVTETIIAPFWFLQEFSSTVAAPVEKSAMEILQQTRLKRAAGE